MWERQTERQISQAEQNTIFNRNRNADRSGEIFDNPLLFLTNPSLVCLVISKQIHVRLEAGGISLFFLIQQIPAQHFYTLEISLYVKYETDLSYFIRTGFLLFVWSWKGLKFCKILFDKEEGRG